MWPLAVIYGIQKGFHTWLSHLQRIGANAKAED